MFQRREISQAKVQDAEPQMSQGMEEREDLSAQLFPPDYPNSFELDPLFSHHST
jgi:hypothetical protein